MRQFIARALQKQHGHLDLQQMCGARIRRLFGRMQRKAEEREAAHAVRRHLQQGGDVLGVVDLDGYGLSWRHRDARLDGFTRSKGALPWTLSSPGCEKQPGILELCQHTPGCGRNPGYVTSC